ncbi:MAG: peptide ABC transporter ATP-binding protein [Deltaproteobacteria bacterium]|nr:MAG: peptide ABC transporter ATP-binding protein [Deltaproteobacteria bacterium]
MDPDVVLKVENLVTAFDTEAGRIRAVEGVGFEVKRGRTLGIVGESGCGKSVTALSIMRLLPRPAGILERGRILFHGQDIAALPAARMHDIRGRGISMIFQEPMTALNPVHRIGRQVEEAFFLHHRDMGAARIRQAAAGLLREVGIPDPERRMAEYPHQISGGMRQRVMIAMALAGRPDVLIADEPTTAIDVTIQAQILELMKRLQQERGMAIVFITHDLGVIAEICDHVVVMYAGKVAERAPVIRLFKDPRHPYTRGLLSSIPRLDSRRKTRLSVIEGMVPGLMDLPDGCRFQNRCPVAIPVCRTDPPALTEVAKDHYVACHRL